MSNDPLSDLLTIIRNACSVKKPTVFIPYTKLNYDIINILNQEGMLAGFKSYVNYVIIIRLRYDKFTRESHIKGIQRVSRPGCRVYTNVKNIPKVLGGMGLTLISTSFGIMVDREARKRNIGGEILCRIW